MTGDSRPGSVGSGRRPSPQATRCALDGFRPTPDNRAGSGDDRKGAQTRDADIAWVWAEDFGGMHPVAPFSAMPIKDKLNALADLVAPILADRAHLAGIAWSSGQWRMQVPPDARADTPAGTGLQLALPIERVRQSAVLNWRLILPDQTARMIQLCTAEPRWLDWALARLGITGGIDTLLAQKQAPLAVGSRLWLP
jgi:hypothetical protein